MDIKETSVEYLACDQHATFYSSEAKWIRKMHELQSEYPEEVTITHQSQDYILVHIPKTWLKIKPPRKMTLTDDQRQAAAQRLYEARKAKKGDA
jgi:hypothetical protein